MGQQNPNGGDIIEGPSKWLPGFKTAKRKTWVFCNWLKSRHWRTAVNLERWGLQESALCMHCKELQSTADHLVLDCPETVVRPGGYVTVRAYERPRPIGQGQWKFCRACRFWKPWSQSVSVRSRSTHGSNISTWRCSHTATTTCGFNLTDSDLVQIFFLNRIPINIGYPS